MLPRANVAALRINDVLKTKVSVTDPENPVQPDANVKGTVEFDHVSFAYPEAGENVISDISFKAEKGETIAVIGSTGSGKSTLINLIPRFYDVTEGQVMVDGMDVREYKITDLRDKIGIVPQKAVLFAGTVRSNLAWGKEDATEEEMQQALSVAQAAEVVDKKDGKLDAEVEQGGKNFSGGQKQRVAIARALYTDPDYILADEPTAALDTDRSMKVIELLRDLAHKRNKIIIVVTHDLRLKDMADKVYQIIDGKMTILEK